MKGDILKFDHGNNLLDVQLGGCISIEGLKKRFNKLLGTKRNKPKKNKKNKTRRKLKR